MILLWKAALMVPWQRVDFNFAHYAKGKRRHLAWPGWR